MSTNSEASSNSVQKKDLYLFSGMKASLSKVSVKELFSREADGLKAMVLAEDGTDLEGSLKLLEATEECPIVLVL